MWSVQDKTVNTAWRTESIYATESEAVQACAELCVREPRNEDGEDIEYRVVEIL